MFPGLSSSPTGFHLLQKVNKRASAHVSPTALKSHKKSLEVSVAEEGMVLVGMSDKFFNGAFLTPFSARISAGLPTVEKKCRV